MFHVVQKIMDSSHINAQKALPKTFCLSVPKVKMTQSIKLQTVIIKKPHHQRTKN